MQATEEYIGSKQPSDIRIPEARTREMQDALSRYRPMLQRRAYQQLGNAADAEDAVQDALLSAYKHLDQFKGQAQVSTWLNAIVTNCARMQLRRRPRQLPCRWMNDSETRRNFACQTNCRPANQVLKMRAATSNCTETCCAS